MNSFDQSVDRDHMRAIRENAFREAVVVYTDRFRTVEHEDIDYVADHIEKDIDRQVDEEKIEPLVGLSMLSALRKISNSARRGGFYPAYWVILAEFQSGEDHYPAVVHTRFDHRDAAIQRMMDMDLTVRNTDGYESVLHDKGIELTISNASLHTTATYRVEQR